MYKALASRRARLLLALASVCLLGEVAFAQGNDLDYHFEFKGGNLPNELQLAGKGADQYVKLEANGLRVTLPKSRKALAPVGIRTNMGLHGDFEVTTTVEIIDAERPKSASSFGTGVTLYLEKVDPAGEGTNIGRLLRAEGKDLIVWDRKFVIPGGQPKYQGGDKRCVDKLVKLRLVRTGSKLSYLWSAGTDQNFHRVHQEEFGAGEIKDVAVRVTTGGEQRSADIRIIDLHIRSGGTLQGGMDWRIVAAAAAGVTALLLVGLAGVGFLLLGRRSRSASKPDAAETAAFSFACSECGKKLKAKPDMTGKKIKCPECGKSTVVPEQP